MGSIEGAFIGLARYIRDHFPHLDWMPLWYGGIPFPDCYPPLLHAAVAAVSGIGHISAALAYHAVTATFYSLGPVTLYWALTRMGATRQGAWIGAAGYSVFSPTLWLVPSVRHGIGGWLAPTRLDAMVSWGEGPHIASLMLLALGLGALCRIGLRPVAPSSPKHLRSSLVYLFVAALVLAATALANWIGAFALALAAAALVLSRGAALLPVAIAGVWAYAIAAPFFTPSTIATIEYNAPLVADGGFLANHLLEAGFAVASVAFAWALLKFRIDPILRFGALFLFFTASVPLLAYWFHLKLVPQPERYHLEMDLAFWLMAGLVISRFKIARPQIAVAAAAVICLPVAIVQHRRVRGLERPIVIASTAEYDVSNWLGAHDAGERVFAPGTIGFWMQAFSDTPMLTGGFDNGRSNRFLPDVLYQIYAGDKQKTALAWLKAFGVGEIVGDWPQSREFYHPYAHPEKFAGLPEVWRDGPEVVYRVPRRRTSLAHAMLLSDLPAVRPPAYDAKPLEHYLAALDDAALPDVSFEWHGPSAATMAGLLRKDQILSVQLTYDKGWHAKTPGGPVPVMADKLGQMIVEPGCNGNCTIELWYDGGFEQRAAWVLSIAALLAGVVLIIGDRRSLPGDRNR